MRHQIGDRVGAILKADHDTVHLLGYGRYDGDQEPPFGPFGMTQEEFEKEAGTRYTNPRITLDDGRVVWGCQCWWGPEEKVKASIGGRTVIAAVIDPG